MKIDLKTRLFTSAHDESLQLLGFDECFDRANKLAKELKKSLPQPYDPKLPDEEGYYQTLYDYYQELVELARERNKKTGWRSKSELTKQLIGLEGAVIQVVDKYDEERTFIVGKSTGFIPVHLEIESDQEDGGAPVFGAPFKSIKVIKH